MDNVKLDLNVIIADYSLEVNLLTGESQRSIDIVASSEAVPSKYPLRLSFTSKLPKNAAGDAMVAREHTNILWPRSEQYSGYCAYVIMPEQALIDLIPMIARECLFMIVFKADRLSDGNSFRLKNALFIQESDLDDFAGGDRIEFSG